MLDGIKTDPFAPLNGKPIYFATAALAERLDLIQHLLHYSDQSLLILGEHGSGKTTLIAQLLARISDPWRVYHIEANPMLDFQLLLKRIASTCGLPVEAQGRDGFEPYLEFLEAHLEACERSGLIPVLLVDNAHELPGESLLLLFSLANPGKQRTLFHIALFCEPEITARLNMPEFSAMKQEIMHVLDIPRFTEEQTQDYLSQRLINSGMSEDITFSQAAVYRIHKDSGGLPGRINVLARQALIEGEGVQEEKRRGQFIAAAALLALFNLVIVIASMTERKPEPTPQVALQVPPSESTREAGEDRIPAGIPKSMAIKSDIARRDQGFKPGALNKEAPSAKPVAEKSGRSQEPSAERKEVTQLKVQHPKGYMLQLLGTHNKEAVNRFLAQHKLRSRVAMVTISRDGKPWFVVVYGPFPDRNKAIAGIASLPPAVQALKPWPRAISGLKETR